MWILTGSAGLVALAHPVSGERAAQAAGSPPAATQTRPAAAVPGRPYKYEDGPLSVEVVETLRIRDAQRNKSLACKVFYPRTTGEAPVIIFSHGAGGSKQGYGALGRYWASHGYAVIHPTHADSIELVAQKTAAAKLQEAVRAALTDEAAWKDRALDISLILDHLEGLGNSLPGFAGRLDASRVGVGGHSFGAFTTQVVGGARIRLGSGAEVSYADRRPKAFLMFSGQGTGQMGLVADSWRDFTRPMMDVTGSRDFGAKNQGPDWRKEPFTHSLPGGKYFVFIENANHFSFTGRLAHERIVGEVDDQDPRTDPRFVAREKVIFAYAKMASLAFWDAYLRDDAEAKAYLASDDLPQLSRGWVTIERR